MSYLVLIDENGRPILATESDRGPDDFPIVATYNRDQVFLRGHVGSLEGVDGFRPDDIGAVYVRTDAWRISTRTVDLPRPNRRRKARIFDFAAFKAARAGGAA